MFHNRKSFVVLLIMSFILLFFTACQNPASSANDTVKIPVITEKLDASDLSTVSGGMAPSDKFEVLDSLLLGIHVLTDNCVDYLDDNPDWEPISGDFTISPVDFFESGPDGDVSISGSLRSEIIDFIDAASSGTITASGSVSGTGIMDGEGTTDDPGIINGIVVLKESVIVARNVINGDYSATVPIAKLAIAVECDADIEILSNPEVGMTQLDLDYDIALIAKLAITVDSIESTDKTGNFIVEIELKDSDKLLLTEQLINDPDGNVIPNYLEDEISPDVLKISIQVYDNLGNQTNSYSYTKLDLINYFKSL